MEVENEKEIASNSGISRKNSYRNIVKGTSIFGSVQVLQVLIGLLRGKFTAIFLGPAGMGISSLFFSALSTLTQFSQLGLNMSIVTQVSEQGEAEGARKIIRVAQRVVMATAIGGMLVTILLSGWLSEVTFGTDSYRWQFVALSLAVFFGVAGAGRMSMLQGLHAVKRLARATLVGGLAGLLFGVPFYWAWGDKGIVPASLAVSVATWAFYEWSFRKECTDALPQAERDERRAISRRLISTGFLLMCSNLLCVLTTYVLNIFMRRMGTFDEVGQYQAANSLITQCSGVVFTTLAMDYLPRLSAVAKQREGLRSVVNRQLEVVGLVIAPVSVLLILFAPLIVRVLLTAAFNDVASLLCWMGFGLSMKALSYPLGYVAIARNDKRVFFWFEGVFENLLLLAIACAMYYRYGLMGLGYAMVIENAIYLGLVWLVTWRLYGYRPTGSVLRKGANAILLSGMAFVISLTTSGWMSVLLIGLVLLISSIYSLVSIRRLIARVA